MITIQLWFQSTNHKLLLPAGSRCSHSTVFLYNGTVVIQRFHRAQTEPPNQQFELGPSDTPNNWSVKTRTRYRSVITLPYFSFVLFLELSFSLSISLSLFENIFLSVLLQQLSFFGLNSIYTYYTHTPLFGFIPFPKSSEALKIAVYTLWHTRSNNK